jgi:hypothetical protein
VASCDLKFDRAEAHLVDIARRVAAYVDSHPYSATLNADGRVITLAIAAQPDPVIAVIVGDMLHNLRSGLDLLAVGLSPRKERYSLSFPVIHHGVWDEPATEGSDSERWQKLTRYLSPAALDLMKQVQPVRPEGHETDTLNSLVAISEFSNRDKHRGLNVVTTRLTNGQLTVEMADGSRRLHGHTGTTVWSERDGIPDGGNLSLSSPIARVVAFRATPRVTLLRGSSDGGYELPGPWQDAIDTCRRIADAFRPLAVWAP